MNYRLIVFLVCPLLFLVSCKNSAEEDMYPDWQARNAQWFAEVYDAALASIAEAKAQHPDDWEKHCDWRIYKTLLKSQDVQGATTDYIVCKINRPSGKEKYPTDALWSPAYTDSVRLHYRGWIMGENYTTSRDKMKVFSQTYYGVFDEKTAAPIAMPVTTTVEGIITAVQYMVKGDDWDIYIPQELAYKENASDVIPAYSTLLFNLKIELVHKSGTGMSEWR